MVPAQKNEVSNVGVVSNVAIYSLKAKVGKLESETEKLKEKVQQLEKEKATLSLLNTESRYCLPLFDLFFSFDYLSVGSAESCDKSFHRKHLT